MTTKYGWRAVGILAALLASAGFIGGAIFVGHHIGREMQRWHGLSGGVTR